MEVEEHRIKNAASFHDFSKSVLSLLLVRPLVIGATTFTSTLHALVFVTAYIHRGEDVAEDIKLISDQSILLSKFYDMFNTLDQETRVENITSYLVDIYTTRLENNQSLIAVLKSTKDTHIVFNGEDRLFTIGILHDDKDQYETEKWLGLNILGNALMRVRTRGNYDSDK